MRGNNFETINMPFMQNIPAETKEKVKGISIRLIIVLSIFAAILLLFIFITHEFVLEGETEFDARVSQFLHSYTSEAATGLMTFFTFFGSTAFFLPAYSLLVLFYIFYKKNNKRSFNIAAIGLSSMAMLKLLKNIFQRDRPTQHLISDVEGFSYPSGHATSAFTFCGLLIYILWISQASKCWKWTGTILLFIFAALVSISRVYLNVHYASDVIAGFCLALLWLTICIYVLRRFNRSDDLPNTQ